MEKIANNKEEKVEHPADRTESHSIVHCQRLVRFHRSIVEKEKSTLYTIDDTMDPSKNSSSNNNGKDGDKLESLMMAAIPRRSLPPISASTTTAATSDSAAAAAASSMLDNMTIPRRSKPSKDHQQQQQRGGNSQQHSLQQHSVGGFRRPSSSGSGKNGHGSSSHHHQQQHQHQHQQQYQQEPKKKKRHVAIRSEYPFLVAIRMKGVDMDQGGIPCRRHIEAPVAAAAPIPVPVPAPAVPSIKRKLIKKEHKVLKKKASSTVTDQMLLGDEATAMGISSSGDVVGRQSSRAPKRERISYAEANEWDGLVDSSDEEQADFGNSNSSSSKPPKQKKLRRGSDNAKDAGQQLLNNDNEAAVPATLALPAAAGAGCDEVALTGLDSGSGEVAAAPTQDGTQIDAPPPGKLGPMWYSRECFLHIFVVEKVVGWKRRTITSLEWDDPNALKFLDPKEANKLSQKALTNGDFWEDPHKRMEVSRINVTQCPVVLSIAAEREKAKASNEGRDPHFKIKVPAAAAAATATVTPLITTNDAGQDEDVLLVKWRGRSYIHCSWERPGDIQKLDPSNSTARHKLRRYYQSQEVALGLDWRKRVEEDRATAAAIHGHGDAVSAEEQPGATEEFFAPQCLEVERIMGCDENEMNMDVLSKQRALNIRIEQEKVRRKEETERRGEGETAKVNPLLLADLVDVSKEEKPWDPEDNVRYVVKWKGLPVAELTWEYWRDIKRDAVNETEDFWHRQKPPDQEVLQDIASRQHPHVRDFKKLQASPTYGLSLRVRPVAKLGDGADVSEEEETEAKQGFQLRSYQLEGVNWLLFNWWNKRSCILADEMGLGKTVQTLGFLQALSNNPLTKIRGPFLIVAPLSLIGQWQSEARGWAPDYNVVLYHGSADARAFLTQQEFYYTEQFVPKGTATKLRKQHVTKFHILITTYEVVLKDIAVFSKIKWRALIVDEAHRLKNADSRLFAELASVPRDHCVLLTGTPLANNTDELWALLHFDDPKAFADREDFLEKFGEMKDAAQVNQLHTILKPYLLRRVKEDVEKSMPPKIETILEVTLTPIQKKYYKAIYERNTAFLYKGSKPSNAPSLMNVMMELRKICNHPFLVKGVEDKILTEGAANWKAKDDQGVDKPIDDLQLFGEQLVKSSGKMVLLEKLLHKLFAGGHKVLIFSQMVRVLDLLEELLKVKKYKYERLDGSTSSSSRASAVDRFNRKSAQRFVMLLSTRAGGLGLNLTSADIVIIFDSDWNPQNDLQAMARAHRIGQTRKVQIFRLLTAKTYEMHMFHSASMKLGLERAILSAQRDQGGDGTDDGQKPKNQKQAQAKEIDLLLKKGAYDVFKDDDDAEAKAFMETDIDELLEKSSKKVTYGASATESMGSALGSFSKASFVTDTGDGEKDVDLDDPDFWAKAVGLDVPVETPEEIAQMLDDGVKRSRKQVQQFNPYSEEQAKVDAIALKEQEERDEKERSRLEKKAKKDKKKRKKEKRKREKEAGQSESGKIKGIPSAPVSVKKVEAPTKKTKSKEVRAIRKHKKNDRRRALRRAVQADPAIERLKQAWEMPQRNRATAAVLRFGFGRFNKIRHESNLTSLPLQDLELFVRSYTYQLALQVAVTFLSQLQKNGNHHQLNVRGMIREWMGPGSEAEADWLCSSVYSVMEHHMEVQSFRRFLRMPQTLADSSFVSSLRQGGAFRALRRLGILSRLNRIIEEGLDSVLSVLGHEELAKRGCGTSDLSTLDADMRARHVSTEETAILIGTHYRKIVDLEAPASWWDRSCDIALLIGVFVHGLGNYQAIGSDEDLPFVHNNKDYAESDEACWSAYAAFQAGAAASRRVFDDALESVKEKAALEIQAAVAAAAAAASEREKDALALRQGGAAADAVISSKPEVASSAPKEEIKYTPNDDRFVTLPWLQTAIIEAVRRSDGKKPSKITKEAKPVSAKSNGEKASSVEVFPDTSSVSAVEGTLPMPDSRILDRRLMALISRLERSLYDADEDYQILEAGNLWKANEDVLTNSKVRTHALANLYDSNALLCQFLSEYSGVGVNGDQCGSSHRSLDDGGDYSIGAATSDLAHVAYGTDSPRYLRAIGVPMNLTRFAISALVYAEASTVQSMLDTERLRFYSTDEKADAKTNEDENKTVTGEAHCKTEASTAESGKPTTEKLPNGADKIEAEAKPGEKTAKEGDPESTDKPSIKFTSGGAPILHAPAQRKPKASVDLVPAEFRGKVKVRAAICSAVLLYGYPSSAVASKAVDTALWSSLQDYVGAVDSKPPAPLFNMDSFMARVNAMTENLVLPPADDVRSYVEKSLLPFCLRLSVMGNGPSTRAARGSRGEFDTAYGISKYPEPSKKLQSPLPDPCMELDEQSIEAVAYASAILRRVRLMRAALHVTSGDVSVEQLGEAARSSFMCKNLGDLPLWWCPWVHDVALLVHAATNGLFSILQDRHNDDSTSVFSQSVIVSSMHSTFVSDGSALPSTLVEQSSPDDPIEWVELHAKEFPSVNVLERRLAFLCSVATVPLQGEMRFDNLPMFDHGGWPRL